MNEKEFISDYFTLCSDLLKNVDISEQAMEAKTIILETKSKKGKLIFAGNGASASISNHASLDFTKQGKVKSVNFNESAFITAFSNDYGYENWLSKAIDFHSDPQDTVILISSSGTSPNVVKAAELIKDRDMNLITFTGFSEENPLKALGDINFWIDCKSYNIIEGIHQLWLLSICDLIIGKTEYSVS